ncbi:MAG: hypothetical protein RLN83_11610 [Balneola sp.]
MRLNTEKESICDFQVFGNTGRKIFFLKTNDFQRVADTICSMLSPEFHMSSGKSHFFKMIIELCELEDEASLLEQIENVIEGLDSRYVASANFAEFLNYCQNLVMNGEYIELKRLLTGKVNKSAPESDKRANVLGLHSFKKAI